MAKIGEMLGNTRMHEIVQRYGFDQRTDIKLPGESAGIVRAARKWDGYSLRRVPFGQEISVTALQLATAFSVLANGGLLMRPRLIDHVRNADGEVVYHNRPAVVRRVLKPSVAARSLAALTQVVERDLDGRSIILAKVHCTDGRTFDAIRDGYSWLLRGALKGRWLVILVFVGLLGGTGWLIQSLPSEYAPKEDRGAFFVLVNGPEGASYDPTEVSIVYDAATNTWIITAADGSIINYDAFDIDYGTAEANTTYGVIGVKVWICKGEVLGKKAAVGIRLL